MKRTGSHPEMKHKWAINMKKENANFIRHQRNSNQDYTEIPSQPSQTEVTKKTNNNKCCQGYKQREALCPIGDHVN